MARYSILFGILMVLLGVGGWVAAGATAAAKTALIIPSAFGGVLILCGLVGAKYPGANKHVMHVAALVALLGTAGGLTMAIKGLLGEPHWLKIVTQGSLGVLCLVFLVLCVRSFIQARVARKQA
ncbi:hypothetical protein [Verrucomicrobium sp. BvORR106]|uniref:hypothetical protein n=1 Tax=Verrucomicrobium sp. BvORR106 TaxID=1403819 RepID=UPI00056ED5E7|nr:hypothetical protein [Verrucomicrobium sp. BvORR106]